MSGGGQPGKKYCPTCKNRVDTNVISGSQENDVVCGIEAKRREIICKVCNTKWHTVEVIETDLKKLVR